MILTYVNRNYINALFSKLFVHSQEWFALKSYATLFYLGQTFVTLLDDVRC